MKKRRNKFDGILDAEKETLIASSNLVFTQSGLNGLVLAVNISVGSLLLLVMAETQLASEYLVAICHCTFLHQSLLV